MSQESLSGDKVVELATALVGPQALDLRLHLDALEELRREGRITCTGAGERRMAREAVVGAKHPVSPILDD